MHAACSAKALAPFPPQGQEEKEVRQRQIHSHRSEARVEDQGQNARAERSASRPSLSNGNGKPDGHFLRKLKAIAKKAGIEGVELHRFRKTYADTLHEEGFR
jgi:integrase